MEETVEKKDYMGTISWSKASCGAPQSFFGTEIKSMTPIRIDINEAEKVRDFSRYYYYPRRKIISIELTPVQWAEFLTSPNQYSGVPCTITQIYDKRIERPSDSKFKEHYNAEANEAIDNFKKSFDKIGDYLENAIASGKPLGKKALEELLGSVKTLKENTVSNLNFVRDSFEEDMEEITVKAKAEFNAYCENRVNQIGLDAINSGAVQFLENKTNQ